MSNNYYIGKCKICQQGMLELVKEIDSGIPFVCCDECEAEWKKPEDALIRKNGTRNKFGKVISLSINEIEVLDWQKFVLE